MTTAKEKLGAKRLSRPRNRANYLFRTSYLARSTMLAH